jgi:hypothetical protein
MLALGDPVLELLERKASFVNGVEQPDEQDDFRFIGAFYGSLS